MSQCITDEQTINALVDRKLDEIALQLKQRAGNTTYQRAWFIAAQIVTSHKTINQK